MDIEEEFLLAELLEEIRHVLSLQVIDEITDREPVLDDQYGFGPDRDRSVGYADECEDGGIVVRSVQDVDVSHDQALDVGDIEPDVEGLRIEDSDVSGGDGMYVRHFDPRDIGEQGIGILIL